MSGRDWEHEISEWIRRCAWDEIEGEGDVVGERPELVDRVISCYRRSPTVEPRAAALRLLPDRFEPAWDPLRRDFLLLDRPEREGPVHLALCRALVERTGALHEIAV